MNTGHLKTLVCDKLGVGDGNDIRLWLIFSQSRRPSNVLADESASVEDARINDGDIIALEQKDGSMWPAERCASRFGAMCRPIAKCVSYAMPQGNEGELQWQPRPNRATCRAGGWPGYAAHVRVVSHVCPKRRMLFFGEVRGQVLARPCFF